MTSTMESVIIMSRILALLDANVRTACSAEVT